MGRGKLTIAAGNRQAVIFVDGQIRGVDKVELADLIPGTYHVFIQVPGTPGRQYETDVTAADESFVNAEPEIDSALWATDSYVSFQFATNAARAQEAKFAGHTSIRWSDRDLVGVVGTGQRAGRPLLIGTIYTTDGTMLRSMALDVQTATPSDISQLARLMAEGGIPTDGIFLIGGGERATASSPGDDDNRTPWWRQPSPYLIGGAALIVASTAVYVETPAYRYPNPTWHDYRTPAVSAFLGSTVVLGGGVYLWLRQDRSASVLEAAATSTGLAATLSGVMLYATNEDPGPLAPPRIRNTAREGVVLGSVGVVTAGAGLLLLWRDRPPSIVPAATVSDHGGLVTISGTF